MANIACNFYVGPQPPTPGPVIIPGQVGQSNRTGQAEVPPETPPAGIPQPLVKYWRKVLVGPQSASSTVLGPLNITVGASKTYFGPELQQGTDLLAAGYDVSIVKCCRNGSTIASWLPGDASGNWNVFAAQLALAQPLIAAAYPGRDLLWVFDWNQGEAEAQLVSSGPALAWAANFATLLAAFRAAVGQNCDFWITQLNPAMGGMPNKANVMAQQALAAAQPGGHLVDTTGIPLGPDLTHYITAAAVDELGSRVATSMLASLPPP